MKDINKIYDKRYPRLTDLVLSSALEVLMYQGICTTVCVSEVITVAESLQVDDVEDWVLEIAELVHGLPD